MQALSNLISSIPSSPTLAVNDKAKALQAGRPRCHRPGWRRPRLCHTAPHHPGGSARHAKRRHPLPRADDRHCARAGSHRRQNGTGKRRPHPRPAPPDYYHAWRQVGFVFGINGRSQSRRRSAHPGTQLGLLQTDGDTGWRRARARQPAQRRQLSHHRRPTTRKNNAAHQSPHGQHSLQPHRARAHPRRA